MSNRNVDDVHDLMDDIAEQQELANEISTAISNPTGFGQDVDDVSFRPSLILCLHLSSLTFTLGVVFLGSPSPVLFWFNLGQLSNQRIVWNIVLILLIILF